MDRLSGALRELAAALEEVSEEAEWEVVEPKSSATPEPDGARRGPVHELRLYVLHLGLHPRLLQRPRLLRVRVRVPRLTALAAWAPRRAASLRTLVGRPARGKGFGLALGA